MVRLWLNTCCPPEKWGPKQLLIILDAENSFYQRSKRGGRGGNILREELYLLIIQIVGGTSNDLSGGGGHVRWIDRMFFTFAHTLSNNILSHPSTHIKSSEREPSLSLLRPQIRRRVNPTPSRL